MSYEPTTKHGIPLSLTPFFQEYDLEQINPAKHQHLIIERVLAYGNRQELRWLFNLYDDQQIISWIQETGHRRLPYRRYNLWCVLFELPIRRIRSGENLIWKH